MSDRLKSPSDSSDLSRRDVARLLGAGALTLAFGNALSFGQSTPAATTTTTATGQGPGFYRFKIDGGIDALLVSDGGFALQPGALFPKAPKDELETIAKANFFTAGYFPGNVNALVIRDGSSTILIDTGAGSNMGPKAGKLIPNLASAGIAPDDVTHVVITHAHPDHVGGLLDEQGRPRFAKARVFIGAVEHAFWTGSDPVKALAAMGTLLPEQATTGMTAAAKGALAPFADHVQLVKGGDSIGNAIRVVEAFGHTPGHLMFDIGTGENPLRYVADLLHVLPIQLPHPEWQLFFDADPTAAAATRAKFIAEIVGKRTLIAGSHLPFPSIGHLGTDGSTPRWTPQIWEW